MVRLAAELNQPPFALIETYHEGPLAQQASYLSDGGGDVVVTVLKGAEDGEGALVLRAYESAGRPSRARIELPLLERTFEAALGAHEIRTYLVPAAAGEDVVETDLLEWR